MISGTTKELTSSFERVVNHKLTYNPPAPFQFVLDTKDLSAIQGTSVTISVSTIGNLMPENAKIRYNNQEYFMRSIKKGGFEFTFTNVVEPINFRMYANEVTSKDYTLKVFKTPTIYQLFIALDYPHYTGKVDEKIDNKGNLLVPEGTKVEWSVLTSQTKEVDFIEQKNRTAFKKRQHDEFFLTKDIRQSFRYQIASSNDALKAYEKLSYSIEVVKDQRPTIVVKSNIDSIKRGDAIFAGQVSDDYGLSRLEVVYYNQETPKEISIIPLPVNSENIQTFYYQFPDKLIIEEGVNYELYFRVYDNDRVNGIKSATSKKFSYRQKTVEELDSEVFQEQINTINDLEQTVQRQKKHQKELDKLQKSIQNKSKINWNDQNKLNQLVERQRKYEQMMQRHAKHLKEILNENKGEDTPMQEKKKELQKRIEELQKLNKQQKLIKELRKMAEKLDRENLVRKTKQLAKENRQQERSLERVLELTKRYYIEEKSMQIANKLEELSNKQNQLSEDPKNTQEQQKEIQKKFDRLSKELDQLQKDNEKLKEPMDLPDLEEEKKDVEEELKNLEDSLQKQQKEQTKKSQKNASRKMKQMSEKIRNSFEAMQANMIDENAKDIRKILENLVVFSFQQEDLMKTFDKTSVQHPDFGKNIKKQNEMRRHFEHIDDSLYIISMRMPQISAKIQENLSEIHCNLDQSLDNFSENRFDQGISNQQYVMTSVNYLADLLSNMLDNMQNSMSSGKGSGNSFSLPDLIQKQKGLSEQMKKGMQKNNDGKNGKTSKQGNQQNKDGDEQSKGDLFKIYQQQQMLRQELEDAIKESGKGTKETKNVIKSMEQLENEILEKGFNKDILQRMKNIVYDMLKLDTAILEQGREKKRKSNTNTLLYNRNVKNTTELKKQIYNQTEILNRQPLPLQRDFKKKVQRYFLKEN